MDKQSTIKLLDETFNQNFKLENFVKFVKELFNKFTVTQKSWNVWKEYSDYIESYQLVGSYTDNYKKIIDVLVIKLKRASSRDRARTMQRNFVAKYLGYTQKDAALVAFYGDDPEDWRFSFVKMEYNLVKDESGKVKPVKELTPAKRYSFLVGVNEPNHTCRSRFLKLVMEEEANPSLSEIEQAFSIDNVTKEFFEKYKELFLELKESLEKVLEKDKNTKKEFEEKNISTIDFSKKLLGQIVFIYFLQKKGWLGIQKSPKEDFAEWGTGPKDFLRKLFDKEIVPYDNFFNDILEPLFYEALATERDYDYYSKFNCKIPFLNGGLFEPINDYDWAKTNIILEDSIFERIFSTFDRFNFTVKEDEPLEKEVAVDPEMLGKVFENLLEVKDRKSKGTFYTPREIVHYMCQQSLINYLETNTSIDRKDIENLIQMGDVALDQTIKAQEQKKKYHGKTFNINESLVISKDIEKNHEKIDKLLKEIKIVDPACGSGAFLIGMLNEIVKARSILSIYSEKERNIYDTKREIIENCLYGVDIESSAVDISKLRFWLSLIVDELDMKNIKPLPNLDYKIMCGNSLLEEFEGVKLFDEKLLEVVEKNHFFEINQIDNEIANLYKEKGEIIRGKSNDKTTKEIDMEIKNLERKKKKILSRPKSTRNLTLDEVEQNRIKKSKKKLEELKKLQKQFFDEQNRRLKKQLRADIDKIEWELIEETLKEQGNEDAMEKLEQYKKNKVKPFFLWKLYFAEVFQRENPGFDVVIANPPYVSYGLRGVDKLSKENKEVIRSLFPNSAEYKISLYVLFMDKSIQLSRMNGVQSLIVPDSFLLGRYFSKIRNHILENNRIDSILLFTNKVFDATVGFSVVYVFQRGNSKDNSLLCSLIEDPSDLIRKKGYRYPQSYFKTTPYNRFRLFFNEYDYQIVTKLDKGNVLRDNFGIYSGCIARYGQKSLISDVPLEHFKIINDGKIIFSDENAINKWRYTIIGGGEFSRYSRIKPKKYIYINKNPEILRKITKSGFDFSHYESEKLFIRQTGDCIISTYDSESLFCLNNVHLLYPIGNELSLKYALAILNSKLLNYYYKKITLEDGRVMAQTDIETLELLPIKEILPEQQKSFIELVNQIFSITKDKDYLDSPDKQAKVKRLEKEIDQLVYKLYELTKEEIKIIEEFGNDK